MVVCLNRGADLHMAQLMPLLLFYSLSLASVKSRLVLPFWCWLTWVVPRKRAIKRVCVYVCLWYVCQVNEARYNQQRVSCVRYLGELYNYRMVESNVIFHTLYSLITFAVSLDGTTTCLSRHCLLIHCFSQCC